MEFTPQEYPIQRNCLMLPLFKRYFSTVPLWYIYGVVFESIGLADFIDTSFANNDDRFRAHIVSEKETKSNLNYLMSIVLGIIMIMD